MTGVGGTGVVTIGAILGMAAHLEGKGCGMIDMAGLAQKGGAVYSHVKLAEQARGYPLDPRRRRRSGPRPRLRPRRDRHQEGARRREAGRDRARGQYRRGDARRLRPQRRLLAARPSGIKRAVLSAAGHDSVAFIDATRIATALTGNAIAANMFMLGYAFQMGRVPLSAAALERAIELNGEAVAMNKAAFTWGRRAALDTARVEALVAPRSAPSGDKLVSASLEETSSGASRS